MRVHIHTIGCRLNEAELEAWSRDFQGRGHQITDDPSNADLFVVNTCTVTAEAARKSRKLMNHLHRINPEAELIASGCFASLEPAQTTKIPGVSLIVPNHNKEQLVEIADRSIQHNDTLRHLPQTDQCMVRNRQRAFIKVQDGCRYQCAYCVVTLARGSEWSRPVDEVIREIHQLCAEGVQEAVLTGVHLGGYGHNTGGNLFSLVQEILQKTDLPRLRLGSLEPWDIPQGFWELFKNPRLMPHLHLPLQSGADSVLRRMARRSTTEQFMCLVESARNAIPHLNVTTDILVGFPGESQKEWQQTVAFCEKAGFGHVHIFPFSARTGTIAAKMSYPVEPSVIKTRCRELNALAAQSKQTVLKRCIDQTYLVLIESNKTAPDQKEHYWSGYTPNYHRVRVSGRLDRSLENRIVSLRIDSLSDDGKALLATLDTTS